VREAALRFLETGKQPASKAPAAGDTKTPKAPKSWPLPDTAVPVPATRTGRGDFPDTSTLVRIAIHEKDANTALRWYESAKKGRYNDHHLHLEVAAAVSESHPDVSLTIWRNLAESQIMLVKPAAYEVAARYLRKMQEVYQRTRRLGEWHDLIRSIRTAHKPKRSLMKILDSLEAKRILDT
jgi:uncharacterized Zn finger protein